MFDYDLLVIGAGSGGVRASRMAAAKGLRVGVIENRYLGGTCVNVGCVPKKLFVYASEYPEKILEARGFGLDASLNDFDWHTLRDNKTNEIKRLNGIYQRMLEQAGVEIIHGTGQLLDAHRVQVGEQVVSSERILIATGTWPFTPDIDGIEHAITSNEAFYLEQFPKRVVVVGGGYIAVEFAGIFNGLGSETHLLYRGDNILRGFDDDVRTFAREQIDAKGVNVHTHTDIVRIEKTADGTFRCHLNNGKHLDVDCVMYATGRRPMTDGLNLGAVGVNTRDNGMLVVDDWFQTSVPSIYALGDVIGTPALTPVALAQGMKFVNHLYGKNPSDTQGELDQQPLSYELIPTAVFCQPNIGTVGLTESQAKQQFAGDVSVYESAFKAMRHTLSGLSERTYMKLLVQRSTDKVIGVHMVGPDAGEMIQGLAVSMTAGATKADFDATLGIHPTAAEEFVTMRTPKAE